MPRRSSTPSLSVPMSMPRYTAVESQETTSPLNCSASSRPSALLPDAVGPTTATSLVRTTHLPNPFVVVEGHGEEHAVQRIFLRQVQRGARQTEGVHGRAVEAGNIRRFDDADVRERPVAK